ncbi:MAG: prepilin peptidase [Pseudomonadota bacterium]
MTGASLAPIALALLVGVAVFAGLLLATKFDGLRPGLPATIVFAAACGALAWLLTPAAVTMAFALWTLVMVLGLAALAAIDGATRTVPDALSVPMIALGLAHAATYPGLIWIHAGAAALVIAIGLFVGLLTRGRSGGWLGGGDVVLLAGTVAWLGPSLIPDVLILTVCGIAVQWATGATMRLRGADSTATPLTEQPLAPALALAQGVIWLGGPLL